MSGKYGHMADLCKQENSLVAIAMSALFVSISLTNTTITTTTTITATTTPCGV